MARVPELQGSSSSSNVDVVVQRAAETLSRPQKAFWAVARTVISAVARLFFRYEVHGAENLPEDGPYILSPNHRSNLDTPLLPLIRRGHIRFMGKDSLWAAGRFAAWFLDSMGGFPVARETADRSALMIAERILEGGEPLVMFPEGTRRTGPIVEPENMYSGPSFVAGRQQVPIIPIGLAGTEAAMPSGSKVIYPRKVVFVVGTPVPPPEPNEKGRVPRSRVQEHTEELRFRIQELFDEATEIANR